MHAPGAGERRMTHDTQCVVVGAGGASRDRTGDLLVANQTLSQLSYGPFRLIFCRLAALRLGSAPHIRFVCSGARRRRALPDAKISARKQLRFALTRRRAADLVGLGGVEPPTSPLSGVRSNQLSYRPGGQRRVAP